MKRTLMLRYYWIAGAMIAALLALLAIRSAMAALSGFNYPDFSSTAGLNLIGNAAQSGSDLRLTPPVNLQAGAVWHQLLWPVEAGFESTFTFRITDLGNPPGGEPGADGIAFIIHPDSPTALGGNGDNIGYGGIANSLVVEFDTYENSSNSDPNNNHISVQNNGAGPNSPDHAYSLGSTTAVPDLSDGATHVARIVYGDSHLQVYIDDVSLLTVFLPDLNSVLNLDDGRAYIGLTSGTGASWEAHDILSWSFTPVGLNLALDKVVDEPLPAVGTQVTFTVTVANEGPIDATGVIISDTQPTGLTFDAVTPSAGSYDSGTGLWTLGDLAAGEDETLTIVATVNQPGISTNSASLDAVDQPDLDKTDNEASADVDGQAADLGLTKSAHPLTINPGGTVTYTLTLNNYGPNDAAGVAVLDPAPPGIVFDSVTASQGSYDSGSGLWSAGDLSAGANAVLTVVATVNDICAVNQAVVSASSLPDLNPANDAAAAGHAKQWINPAGGNWNMAANWSNSLLPTPADNVCITLDGTYTVNMDASPTVNSLTLGASAGPNQQTLTIASGRTLTLNAGGAIRSNGILNWTGGTISGGATLTNAGQVLMSTSSSKFLNNATTLVNEATVIWNGGIFYIAGMSTFDNRDLFEMQSDNTIDGSGATPNTFINDLAGIVRKSAGTSNSTFNSDITLQNQGVIDAQTGTILINGPSTQTGAELTAASGATVSFSAGAHTISGALSGSPAGLVRLAGTAIFQADPAGGSLDFAGAGFVWEDGVIGGGNTITNTGLLLISTSSTNDLDDATTLVNEGDVIWTAGALQILDVSTFDNRGLFEMQSDNTIDGSGVTPNTFINGLAGIVRKSAGTGNSTFNSDITLQNQGVIDAQTGTILINGPFTHSDGALIQGAGAVNVASASMTHDGDTGPGSSAGMLTWVGPYSPSPAATLHIELGGLLPGSEHDQLVISGSAILSGTLDAALLNGFVPAEGDSFVVLTADSVSGAFLNDSVNAGNGVVLSIVYGPTSVTLVAEGAPISITITPLNPPIVIPAGGGTYRYRAELTNISAVEQTFLLWFEIVGPGVFKRVGPVQLTLQPGQVWAKNITQRIPAGAPPGSYSHNGYAGLSPTNYYATAGFPWEKAAPENPAAPVAGLPILSWPTDLYQLLPAGALLKQ